MNLSKKSFLVSVLVFFIQGNNLVFSQKKNSFEGQLDTFEYAKPNGERLFLDLYRPKKITSNIPVVIFVHGGGWRSGKRRSALNKASWLVAHGFAVASIDYRLTNVAQWPAQINDCYEAVRWLRSHAKELRLNSEKIGAWGTSAGAHLAALMGTRLYDNKETVSSKVQAVCNWFGPSDLLRMPSNNIGNGRTKEDIAKTNGAKLLGHTVIEVPEMAKDASPLYNVTKDDAPMLIMHGDKDMAVPIEQSKILYKKLLDTGVTASEFKIIKGATHGSIEFSHLDSRETVVNFFRKHLKNNEK